MTALDIFVILLLGGSAMIGFVRGFAHEVLALFAWIIAIAALKFLHSPLQQAMVGPVGNEPGASALAFALMSIGLSFLGGTAAVVQSMQEGLLQAWGRLPDPVIAVDSLRNPMPVSSGLTLSQQELGVVTGWIIGIGVYAALAYLTFLHDWSKEGTARGSGGERA